MILKRLVVVLVTLLLLVSLSCGKGENTTKHTKSFAAETVSTIDSLFAEFDTITSPGYGIGILKDTTKVFTKGYGAANLDYGLPITSETAFDIASVSKQFTGAGIALLLMDKQLSLEDPVENYLPELAKYTDTIRIKHLLYNTSGLTDYFKLPRKNGKSWLDLYYFDINEAIATSLSTDTLAFIPGTQWDYCNTNFMLLTKVIEKVSGSSFPVFMKERLFTPLHMNHTLVNDDITAVIPNRATPYNPRNSFYRNAYAQEGIHINETGDWIQHHRNSPHYGGSGIISTVTDLQKWERNFFTRELGGNTFYELMHQTLHFQHDRDNQAFGLYFGEYQGRTYVAWDGATAGVSTQIMRFPKEQIAIMVLSNLGSGEAAAKANAIADILIKQGEL